VFSNEKQDYVDKVGISLVFHVDDNKIFELLRLVGVQNNAMRCRIENPRLRG